jgi:hypothetical protein
VSMTASAPRPCSLTRRLLVHSGTVAAIESRHGIPDKNFIIQRKCFNLFFPIKCSRQEHGNNLCAFYICEFIHNFMVEPKKAMVKNWYVYKIISFVDFCTLISININSFIFILWFCMWQLKEMRSEILPPRTNTSNSRTIMWISIISGHKSKRRILFGRKKCG